MVRNLNISVAKDARNYYIKRMMFTVMYLLRVNITDIQNTDKGLANKCHDP